MYFKIHLKQNITRFQQNITRTKKCNCLNIHFNELKRQIIFCSSSIIFIILKYIFEINIYFRANGFVSLLEIGN